MNKYIIILIVLFLLFWKKTSKNPDGLTAEQIDAIKDDAINNGSIYDDEFNEQETVLPKPILAINLNQPKPVIPLTGYPNPTSPVDVVTSPVKPIKGDFIKNNDVV